jgi:hypothetical protein
LKPFPGPNRIRESLGSDIAGMGDQFAAAVR